MNESDKSNSEQLNNSVVANQTKGHIRELGSALKSLQLNSDTQRELTVLDTVRGSRERSVAITKVQEAILWLQEDLRSIWNEEDKKLQSTVGA